MNERRAQQTREHEFQEVVQNESPRADHLDMEDLKNVRLSITADLGEAKMTVRDILELKEGSVIPLEKLAGEMTDILVNAIPLAKGEVVVIADALHVRVSEIIGAVTEEKEVPEE
jgi:flagellar motor switch protein FliN/FliY